MRKVQHLFKSFNLVCSKNLFRLYINKCLKAICNLIFPKCLLVLGKQGAGRAHFTFGQILPTISLFRSSHPEVFLIKGVLKIYSKFTGEHPWRSVISIKLQSNFIEITLWHECSPVNLLYIFRTPFIKNTSGRLLLSTV